MYRKLLAVSYAVICSHSLRNGASRPAIYLCNTLTDRHRHFGDYMRINLSFDDTQSGAQQHYILILFVGPFAINAKALRQRLVWQVSWHSCEEGYMDLEAHVRGMFEPLNNSYIVDTNRFLEGFACTTIFIANAMTSVHYT